MKKFASYLIPSLIASVLMSMYAIVDGIFIGQKIGDVGLAAINITWPITSFLQSIGTAMGLAGGIYIQKLLARKEEKKASKIKLTTLLMVIILGIIFGLLFYAVRIPLLYTLGATEESFGYALNYLRVILIGSVFQMTGMTFIPLLKNSNKVKLAAAASLSSVFTNLILDYAFIYGLDMDLYGAALASVLAQVVSSIICLFAYFKEFKGISLEKKDYWEISKISIAPFILAYSYSIVIIISNLVCTSFGGDEAVAAYTLLSYLSYIIIAVACAVGDSIQPLFSFNQAAGDYQSNYRMLKYCFIISFLCCGVFILLMVLFNNQLGELYNLSEKSFAYYQDGLVYYMIGGALVSIIKVSSSYLYAIDAKLFANILVIAEPFILTPIAFLIFCFPLKLYGVWTSYTFVQVSLLILAGTLLWIQKNKIQKKCSFKN